MLPAAAGAVFLGLGGGACWARIATNDRPPQVTMADRRKTTRFMDLPLFYLRRGGAVGGYSAISRVELLPGSRIGFVRGLLIVVLAAAAWAQPATPPAPIFPADDETPEQGHAAELLEAVCPGKVVTDK